MYRLADNPEMLWPRESVLASIGGAWWVAHTKARCEKAFAHDLAALGIAYFLPMIERTTFSGGRKRRGLVPLFNSYVFFAGADRERHAALLTDRLCNVIEVHDQQRLVVELSAAHRVISGEATVDLYPFAAIGRRVRVTRGPLEGVEGVVVRRDGSERFVVEVSILGQGAAMEIAPELLEAVDGAIAATESVLSMAVMDRPRSGAIETIACECCGGLRNPPVTRKRGYTLRRCESCDVIFVWPRPSADELASLYTKSAGYFATAQTDLTGLAPASAMWLDSALLAHGMRRGRLLDVGCANGSLIYCLRGLGWDVTGVDLNADAVAIARKHGLNAIAGTLESAGFQRDSFDVVYLGDVIEHVPSPRGVVREIHRVLRPGGMVALRTPNARSGYAAITLWLSWLTGSSWAHAEAPYHLHEFSRRSLQTLLEMNEFQMKWNVAEGRRRFLYKLGATGSFDQLKRRMKTRGGYGAGVEVVPHLPALALAAVVLGPVSMAGRVFDFLTSGGSDLFVGAVKK